VDEYAPAGIARSAFGGQTCNPYDTSLKVSIDVEEIIPAGLGRSFE
jgi:hypothetical protein